MIEKVREIKGKLKTGRTTIGSWMQLPDSSVAEIMGKAGYDWVAVDLEHGRFSEGKVVDIFRALELGGTLPFARIAQTGAREIKQVLDSGARGIIFPMIENRQQLEEAVEQSLYPPQGNRGVGFCRANLFGQEFDAYIKTAQDTVLVAQIEHIRAVENLEDILEVASLDAVMVGPYDLSASMGLTAQFGDPRFLEVIETIRRKTREKQIPMGAHVVQPDPVGLKEKIADGYQFLAYSIDATFLSQSSRAPRVEE